MIRKVRKFLRGNKQFYLWNVYRIFQAVLVNVEVINSGHFQFFVSVKKQKTQFSYRTTRQETKRSHSENNPHHC